MSETTVINPRGLYQCDGVTTGTQTITFTAADTSKDGSAITFSPAFKSAPKLVSLTIEKVVEANSPVAGVHGLQVKAGTTIASTGMTLTATRSAAPAGTATVALTVRYTLAGDKYD